MQSPNYFTCYITIPLYVFQQDENEQCALLPVRQSPMDLGRSRPSSKYKARPRRLLHIVTQACAAFDSIAHFSLPASPIIFCRLPFNYLFFYGFNRRFFEKRLNGLK